MSERRRVIKSIPISGNSEVNTLEVELYYSAGGMNYFNYKNEARGYYLSASPYKILHEGRFVTKTYGAFSGSKILIQESSRFGKKKFDTLVIDNATVNNLVNEVLTRNNLTVTESKLAA